MHHLELFNDKDPIGLWEWIKSDVQDMVHIFSAYRQKQLHLEINSLHTSLRRLNARIYRGENLDIDRERLENRLLTLKDCIWFDKSADYEDDWLCTEGTMSLDFLHLEDERTYLFLEKILVAGEVVTDDEKILNKVGNFYTNLYRAKSEKSCQQIQDFLKSVGSLLHTMQDTSGLVGPVTEKEVLSAISCLRSSRSPGSDGLTSEFYKHFAEQVAPILAKVFNTCFQNKSLTLSQCLVIIILLFKKGDSMLLGNYRLISLTNSDYKILAYILTTRFEEHLTDVIVVNQTACMKGCFIGCNIQSI